MATAVVVVVGCEHGPVHDKGTVREPWSKKGPWWWWSSSAADMVPCTITTPSTITALSITDTVMTMDGTVAVAIMAMTMGTAFAMSDIVRGSTIFWPLMGRRRNVLATVNSLTMFWPLGTAPQFFGPCRTTSPETAMAVAIGRGRHNVLAMGVATVQISILGADLSPKIEVDAPQLQPVVVFIMLAFIMFHL